MSFHCSAYVPKDKHYVSQITEALRRYGVSDATTDLIVVRVGEANLDSAKIQQLMEEIVLGRMVPYAELKDITDWSSIKKVRSVDIYL